MAVQRLRPFVPVLSMLALAACWAAGVTTPLAQASQQPAGVDGLDILQLRPGIHVIAGAGANILVQHGEEGAIVVDTGEALRAPAVLAAIRQITNRPIRYVINTTDRPDHLGGNAAVAAAGQWFTARAGALGGVIGATGGASIVATEEVALRMALPVSGHAPYPSAAWPSESFSGRRKPLRLNGDPIELIPFAGAHRDGDLVVFFRGSDVIAAGDLIDMTGFPLIDIERGGSVQGLLRGLNELKDLAIPQVPLAWKDGGTLVVPGHGRIVEKDDVVQYRDMVTIVRDVVQRMIDRGMTAEQVVAAQPARGYAPRYGTRPGSTDEFVRSVDASLRAAR